MIALVAGKAAVALETDIAAMITPREEDDMTAYLKLPIVSRAMAILRKIFSRQQINTLPEVCLRKLSNFRFIVFSVIF